MSTRAVRGDAAPPAAVSNSPTKTSNAEITVVNRPATAVEASVPVDSQHTKPIRVKLPLTAASEPATANATEVRSAPTSLFSSPSNVSSLFPGSGPGPVTSMSSSTSGAAASPTNINSGPAAASSPSSIFQNGAGPPLSSSEQKQPLFTLPSTPARPLFGSAPQTAESSTSSPFRRQNRNLSPALSTPAFGGLSFGQKIDLCSPAPARSLFDTTPTLFSPPSPFAVTPISKNPGVPAEKNNGTFGVKFQPMPCKNYDGETVEFQAISTSSPWMDYSVEELRFIDYTVHKLHPKIPGISPPDVTFSRSETIFSPCHGELKLLEGPGIELVVGPDSSQARTWTLPTALISHHSAFLKAASTGNFKERHDRRIKLPTDNPEIVSLFIHWMYFGAYPRQTLGYHDAEAWVLGDKLLASKFQNHAMENLYKRYVGGQPKKEPITAADCSYVFAHTTPSSRLHQFYLHYLATFYSSSDRVAGDVESWDAMLCEHDDVRVFVLRALRMAPSERKFVKVIDRYMVRAT